MSNELIRKAVELADGWQIESHAIRINRTRVHYQIQRLLPDRDLPQWILDALAAQLVRQVDVLGGPWLVFERYGADKYITDVFVSPDFQPAHASGPDRTLNTIKAIVDSGVLE